MRWQFEQRGCWRRRAIGRGCFKRLQRTSPPGRICTGTTGWLIPTTHAFGNGAQCRALTPPLSWGVREVKGNGRRVVNVEAAMVARAVGGALLIAIIAAIIVTLVSLTMLLREPIYEPTARVWVVRELTVGRPSPGPNSILSETTPAMVSLVDSRPTAKEARRSLGLLAGSAKILDNLKITRV